MLLVEGQLYLIEVSNLMLSGIRKLVCCNIQAEAVSERIQLRNEIIDRLQPIMLGVTICDRPTLNQNGLTQYNYDENHQSILKRRVHIARQFDLTLSDAPFDHRFVFDLAMAVKNAHRMPGQCAEMACLSAVELRDIATKAELFVYTIQMPDYNHTITLLSANRYIKAEKVDWTKEFKSESIVVDLWQGALDTQNLDALVSPAKINIYTKSCPRAIIQCNVTN